MRELNIEQVREISGGWTPDAVVTDPAGIAALLAAMQARYGASVTVAMLRDAMGQVR